MTILLAHHLELQHIPVLAAIFASGIWIGWQFTGRLLGDGISRIK
jgi:hypothetical protein